MNLISQIFLIIAITLLTGTAALGIWRRLRNVFRRRNPDLACLTLRCVCLLYFIPIGYILVQLTVRNGYIQSDGLWQMNFLRTDILNIIYILLFAAWVFRTSKKAYDYMEREKAWKETLMGNVPEEDDTIIEDFERLKKEFKIRRDIQLYRNDMVDSPMLIGTFHCMVIVPYKAYSREQMEVFFYHELTHYKSHDVWFKILGICINIINPFESYSENFLTLFNEWSEYDCDRKVLTAKNSKMTAGHYFEMIVESKSGVPDLGSKDYIFSMLCENQTSLERRIEYMKKYGEMKRTAKGVTALLTGLFVMFSVTTVYAASAGLSSAQEFVYKHTEKLTPVAAAAVNAEGQQEVGFISGLEDDTYDRIVYVDRDPNSVMTLLEEDEAQTFQWTVAPQIRYVSDYIDVTTDQKISVVCSSSPGTVLYWIGIMNKSGDVWFYSGKGGLSYNFDVPKDGKYRVLVQNRGKQTITATGVFSYYTPEPEEETTEQP